MRRENKIGWICACLLALSVGSIHAQVDIQRIKADTAYWSAEGQGITLEEADQDALAQISRQIAVHVATLVREEDYGEDLGDGSGFSGQKRNLMMEFVSSSLLRNVDMLVLQDEPSARVFRWVAKAEVERMKEERSLKIQDYVATGKRAEERLQLDDALRYYYWALMLATTQAEPVNVSFDGEEGNCRSLLPVKIKSVLANLRVELADYSMEDTHCLARLRFLYGGREVASLQFRYFDGQSFVGPVSVRDGIGEIDLIALPENQKIRLNYETRFRSEAENLDTDLRMAFERSNALVISGSNVEIPVKVNAKRSLLRQSGESVSIVDTPAQQLLAPEPTRDKARIELEEVPDATLYAEALSKVEEAIRSGEPESAYSCFSPEGYPMFRDLLKQTGRVSLSGKSEYTFVRTDNEVLARFCQVKIKFKNGKTFMEKLVFRFNPQDRKIHSLAFALTRKAEDDIFNAATKWSEISRYTILGFMEDYQTAYALKRLDYLRQIFSDKAIIITGTVLSETDPTLANLSDGQRISLGKGRQNIRYDKMSKEGYLNRLSQHFKSREYIHLTFEDNVTHIINTNGRVPYGDAFGIQIKQIYTSPSYSDKGYLTLMLNMQGKHPVIEVRLWQPDKDEVVDLDHFFSSKNFSW